MNTAPFQSYSNMMYMLENDKLSRKDVYTELMKKEDKVLDITSRLANKNNTVQKENLLFVNLSISDLIARFAFTWQNIFNEFIIERRYDELPMILFANERKFYVGMMFIIISVFLILMSF